MVSSVFNEKGTRTTVVPRQCDVQEPPGDRSFPLQIVKEGTGGREIGKQHEDLAVAQYVTWWAQKLTLLLIFLTS